MLLTSPFHYKYYQITLPPNHHNRHRVPTFSLPSHQKIPLITQNNSNTEKTETYNFESSFDSLTDTKRFESPPVEVKELEELPEQWRRSKLAWLCKELPPHRSGTFVRVLNAQRKWIRQVDCVFIVVHCFRIRDNEAAFKVYKWMMQQPWFRFDFALATKLADYLGKDRKPLKCREIFDDITNQGLIPSESTFHILVIAYLSSSGSTYLEDACSVYNRMIHLGSYKPRLSLHNSLFRALVGKTGDSCKKHLKQAEFIFHNLTSCGLKVHNDIYGGLIWLHSYQDVIDKERIALLRAEMKMKRIEESVEVLVSVLRACAKDGDVAEAERTWTKVTSSKSKPPSQAFVYLMEVYYKIGQPLKSLEIFRSMQERGLSNVVAYYKIIEILCKAQETELAEFLMTEFIDSGMKPLTRSFVDLLEMYARLNFHEKVGSTFARCLEKCPPNQSVYSIYLDSLVRNNYIDIAEEIFNQMHDDEAIGVNEKTCNTILRGYLTSEHHSKAIKIFTFMSEKKYEIESSLLEKLEYAIRLSRKEVNKSKTLKLSEEQREILIGLLLGGLTVKWDEEKKSHSINFMFREDSKIHYFLRRHIHNKFHEWLDSKLLLGDIPCQFTTISHSYFKFYADQFFPQGQRAIPKLIHRWLSPRVLAYWYMYGGYRTSSGDILLRLKFSEEDATRMAKTLKAKSLNCRVKKKGTVFWMGFLGNDAVELWKVVEPFVLGDLKGCLEAGVESSDGITSSRRDYSDGDVST